MSDLILISYYWVNSATHVYIRPQNINNKSMKQNWTPSVRRYPHWHLFSPVSFFPVTHTFILFLFDHVSFFLFLFSCYLFSTTLLLFFLLPFFLLLFFRGKIVTFSPVSLSPSRLLPFFLLLFFLLLFFLPQTVTFFPVTFFPVTFFPSTVFYGCLESLTELSALWGTLYALEIHIWIFMYVY